MTRLAGLPGWGVAVLLCLGPGFAAPESREQAEKTLEGSPAPAIARQTFGGATLDLRSLRGHVILLNFWASWCAPCLAEMPIFARWRRDDGPRGLEVIGVSMDDEPGPAERVAQRLGLRYPLLRGDAALARSYGGVLGLPVTFLIDRGGVVRRRFDGAADLVTVHREVERLLARAGV